MSFVKNQGLRRATRTAGENCRTPATRCRSARILLRVVLARFLVGPDGCEITCLTYTPDLKTFFVNIQHPANDAGAWPSSVQGNNLPGRSSTIVVRHKDGKVVGS